jgi:hypothetical protein
MDTNTPNSTKKSYWMGGSGFVSARRGGRQIVAPDPLSTALKALSVAS